jgi:hypothetical protein
MEDHSARSVIVRWSRSWAAAASLVLAAPAGLAGRMALELRPGFGRISLGALAALLAAATLRQLALLVRPLRMFAATERGITTFLDGHRYGGSGFLVPWSSVASMERVVRVMQPGNRRFETVAVRVREPQRVPARVSYGGCDEAHVLHLDATTPGSMSRIPWYSLGVAHFAIPRRPTQARHA